MKDIYTKDLTLEAEVNLFCWIANKRRFKNIIFVDVYDSTGRIQCVAERNSCKGFNDLEKASVESAVKLFGRKKSDEDFEIVTFDIVAAAEFSVTPSPNYSAFDPFESRFGKQILKHPAFYVRNRQLSSCYYFKAVFKKELQIFFWENGFVEFESPTLTRQTLYSDNSALWLEQDGSRVSLSRCATFHLEPAIIAFEKVFTIANSHANEKGSSKRHLVEFTHLKAEVCWCNLEELILFAAKMYSEVAERVIAICQDTIKDIIDQRTLEKKIRQLRSIGQSVITYDEAVEVLKSAGIEFEYGKSLSTSHERILTSYFGEKFVWIKHIPYTVEGFMFKRIEENKFLTKTCDLIAPDGFGEILGCAEKITDYTQLIESMRQKEKWQDHEKYIDYLLLHKYGLPPHGGIGMGIERAVRFLLNLDDVKYTKPFAIKRIAHVNH